MSPYPWHFRGNTLCDADSRPIYRVENQGAELTIAEDMANRRAMEAGPELVAFVAKVSRTAEGGPYPADCLHAIVTDARALLAKLSQP